MNLSSLNPIEKVRIPIEKSDWRSWSRANWNEAIFKHYFLDSDGEDLPVYRIPVTPNELVKIVRETDIAVEEVQEAFLKTVRTPTHIDYNHRLANYNFDLKIGWQGHRIPPFFIDLAFSCFVASPPNEDVKKEGDFRRRLALLMEHDPGVSYPLAELADLWRAFSQWLDVMRNKGKPYRRLELPHPGREVRIGFSLKLTFPSRRDHDTLVGLFANEGFANDPPIPNILSILGKNKFRFSENFWEAYDDFRRAFVGKDRELEKYPFWGAVRDAVASIQNQQVNAAEDQHSLKFVYEPDGFVLLLSTLPKTFPDCALEFVNADTPYGEFSNVLCKGDESVSGFLVATKQLLSGAYREKMNGIGWSAIDIAIRQGVLFFAKTDVLSWELIFVRRDEGELNGLVRNSLIQQFLTAFPLDKRPETRESKYSNWTEIEQFPACWLMSMQYTERSPLSQIRCLQPTVTGTSLRLIGGCPVNDGFLGIPHLLPLVRSSSSDTVEVIPEDSNSKAQSISLHRSDSNSSDFYFPCEIKQPLSGLYRIACRQSGRVLAQKTTNFYQEIHVNEYRQPAEPKAWKVEACGPDVMSYQNTSDHTTESEDNDEDVVMVAKPAKAPNKYNASSSRLIDHEYQDLGLTVVEYSVWDESNFIEASRFMEICGSLATKRRGIAESDLIEIMSQCLNLSQYRRKWDVLRAWTEGGYFERLDHLRWRRTEYYARTPRFSLQVLEDGRIRGTLLGLATSAYRNRADVELSKKGCTKAQMKSLSKWVMPPPAWISQEEIPFTDVSNYLGLELPIWADPIVPTLWPMSAVIAERNIPPRFYERSGYWDWDHGWFSRNEIPNQVGVEILRFHRPDRPSYYQITVDGESIWWSISRNWSLLFAHVLTGHPVFALTDSNQVVRVSKGQIYLPLPVGRYLAKTGTTSPGPSEDAYEYSYTFRSSEERTNLLAVIFGSHKSNNAELQRWAQWMLALSKRANLDPSIVCVPVPSDLRHVLIRFKHVPELCELSQTRLAPYLLYRLRQGISKFSELVEV
ncbi:MAG: hypothetical protein R3C14_21120 [Caldilineaceae bacterium]